METNQLDYLKKQVLFTGFGNVLDIKIEQNVAKGLAEFQEPYSRDFGKDKARAILYFTRSERGHYFFNKFDLTVDKEKGASLTHTFYINNKAKSIEGEKPKNKTFTLKEAYNQLCGRFVLKTLDNKEGVETTAWRGINLAEKNEKGRFKSISYPAANLDIEKAIKQLGYPVKEMEFPERAEEFVRSIEKGDRVTATLISEGEEFKRPLVADPEFRQLKIDTPLSVSVKKDKSEGKAQEQGKGKDNKTPSEKKAHKDNIEGNNGQRRMRKIT